MIIWSKNTAGLINDYKKNRNEISNAQRACDRIFCEFIHSWAKNLVVRHPTVKVEVSRINVTTNSIKFRIHEGVGTDSNKLADSLDGLYKCLTENFKSHAVHKVFDGGYFHLCSEDVVKIEVGDKYIGKEKDGTALRDVGDDDT
jgi:hypothetical protein